MVTSFASSSSAFRIGVMVFLFLVLGIYEINGIGHGHRQEIGRPSPDVKFVDCCRHIHQLPAELAHIGKKSV
jgi:Na+-transporting methylmalonyl-CoA/oxaloacetate decarboxylase gamma subunit